MKNGLAKANGQSSASGTLSSTKQHTLKQAISCSGTGLHSGHKVSMVLRPAAPDTGIVFRRTDLAAVGTEIPARWDHVVETRLNTTLGHEDGTTIGTVEHLIAAMAGLSVDNVIVEIDGSEVPVMDGSAEPFAFLIECAGIVEQPVARKMIQILQPVSVSDGDCSASLMPASGFSLSFEIDFGNAVIGRQKRIFNLVDGAFRSELARARTFGFEDEISHLRANGLAQGGSLENVVVVSDNSILNPDGLRFDDEFVRHKLLDSIGDLYLAGYPIEGCFHGYKSGHALNNKLLRAMFAKQECWRLTDAVDTDVTATPLQAQPTPELDLVVSA